MTKRKESGYDIWLRNVCARMCDLLCWNNTRRMNLSGFCAFLLCLELSMLLERRKRSIREVFGTTRGILFSGRNINIVLAMHEHTMLRQAIGGSFCFTSLEGDDRLAELLYHVNPPPFYSHHCIFVQIILTVKTTDNRNREVMKKSV